MKKLSIFLVALGIAFAMTGCGGSNLDTQSNGINPKITEAELAGHIETLASDEFGGRAPGTPGGEKTVRYIKNHFEKVGLQPGNGDSWYQQVPLVTLTLEQKPTITFKGLKNEPVTLKNGSQAIVWTTRIKEKVSLKNSEMVFVGYGVKAPEWNWNDYEGLDVEGKTVVMLVNDPGFGTGDTTLFKGRTMTYYGRWTYKYEEAARQGAAAAIVIHETVPAGYPWEVVTGSWSGPQYYMVPDNKNMDRVKVEGWITHQFANRLFQNIGLTYEEAKKVAMQEDFEPIPLNVTMSVTLHNKIEKMKSRNVVGVLKGSKRPKETVIYMAHWDHLGTDTTLTGDQIYNGAVDNATGVAGLIEIAEKFAGLKENPARSVVFLAVTAEESGLLGSKYYANNPIYPLGLTAGVINMDALNVHGKTKNMIVVGYGMNELQGYLEEVLQEQGRVAVPEPHPEKGFYFRSDHFSFAKKGVPALYAEAGLNYVKGGVERGQRLAEQYTSKYYHKPSDEYRPKEWDLSGMKQNLKAFYKVGYALADTTDWPGWSDKASFKAIRQKTAEMRK